MLVLYEELPRYIECKYIDTLLFDVQKTYPMKMNNLLGKDFGART